MQPVEAKRGEEQRVYAANGGEEQRVCVERVWGANLQRIVPFV